MWKLSIRQTNFRIHMSGEINSVFKDFSAVIWTRNLRWFSMDMNHMTFHVTSVLSYFFAKITTIMFSYNSILFRKLNSYQEIHHGCFRQQCWKDRKNRPSQKKLANPT